MTKKIAIALLAMIALISACKKNNTSVDSRITAHYLFKPGTWWVYSDYNGHMDSQYVSANGSKNGLPYMQIQEFINDSPRATIYIGAGPASHQLQLWGYGYHNGNSPQTIFDLNTPNVGDVVAQGLLFAGFTNSGITPPGVSGNPISYSVDYTSSNKNQEYEAVDYYFYADYGIVERTEYSTPMGDLYWTLTKSHIIQ